MNIGRGRLALALPLVFSSIVAACDAQPGAMDADAGPDDTPDAGGGDGIAMDLFGPMGHTFRFVVSPEQAKQMDEQFGGGGGPFGDQYDLGGGTYADDLIITDVADGDVHAFGKVQLSLIGQSSWRPWNRIPNLRVDMDEFQPGTRIDGVEHVRLNNGQVGGLFREAVALRLWGALGYPVPRTSFAWAEAPNQWGEATRVPYTLVEVYKPGWCDHAMNGECLNMWEGAGEIDSLAGQCQFDVCDDSRLYDLTYALQEVPFGPGYAAATEGYIDWDAFRSFQCLSWISATGDDYLHNTNNLVLVERTDGRFQFLPYSVDISAGQEWYPFVNLIGHSMLAQGCQTDPECWAATLDRCDELLTAYDELDPVASIVEPLIAGVAAAGMMRGGDDVRAAQLRAWYGARSSELRADPVWDAQPCLDGSTCEGREDGKTFCNGVCVEPPPTCFDDQPCPDGFFCDGFGSCIPF